MDKNVWKDFELAVKQHRWDEMHPNAKKGKPIFPRRFYAVKVKLVGQKPQYLDLHNESYYSYYGGTEYDTSYDLVIKKKDACYFTDYSDAKENLELYTFSTCEEKDFEWAKIITIWKRSRAPYEWDGHNWFQSKICEISGMSKHYLQTFWQTEMMYGRFKAVMGYPFWPHNVIRNMYYKLRYPQQRFFRKGDDFLF